MLRVDREGKKLTRLKQPTLQDVGLLERYDIQKMVRESPEPFFEEMGEELLLLGEEVKPSDFVGDSIDLLALDKQGATVVIELKRGNDRYQLLQALSYASMIAKWRPERIIDARARLANESADEAEEQLAQFLDVSIEDLNLSQRAVLLAEAFDFEVLSSAEWLHENYEVDVRCYRLSVSTDDDSEFLTCTCIYPPPELREHAIPRGRRGERPPRWANWDEALGRIENPAVKAFFEKHVSAGTESNLHSRSVMFRAGGKRRWFVEAHRKHGYVWQEGRFENDEPFWKEKLGPKVRIGPVKEGLALRFYIESKHQFEAFEKALAEDAAEVEFQTVEEGRRANEQS